ncbi:MAG: NAD(P)-binding domain-containing protein [Sandaracinaceae bacterium]|nr:NAD(P)-binding domain-containing protein [Sandaracinaceae bacterium]
MTLMRVGVFGGGSFGVALAKASARGGHVVKLHSRRDPFQGVARPERLDVVSDPAQLADCDLIFLATPSVHVEEVAVSLGRHLDGRHYVVHVSRGLVGDALEPVSHVLRRLTPVRRIGCLAGPISVASLADGEPGGGIVGTEFPEVADAVRDAIGGPSLRLYQTEDLVGCETSSALVGLLALALGYAVEMGFGPSTRAVLMTRGMAEAGRVGVSLGGEERTFAGMAGFGDLLSAVAGDERPEVRLGRAVARGLSLDAAAKEASAYVEGVVIARRIQRHAARKNIDVPISESMADLLEGKTSPSEALAKLMSRKVRRE